MLCGLADLETNCDFFFLKRACRLGNKSLMIFGNANEWNCLQYREEL